MRKTICRLCYGLVLLAAADVTVGSNAPSAGLRSARAQAAEPCQAQVDEALSRLAVTPDTIREISIVPRRQSYRNGWVIKGYDAWVRLKSCQGALVMDYDWTCRERQVYTRGDCRVEGVKAF